MNLSICSRIFNWRNEKPLSVIFMDSAIIASIAFFSLLNDTPSLQNIYVCAKAFGIAFFGQLAFERGLKPAFKK